MPRAAAPAADGIDYGVCVPRDLQDVQLVEAAREQGADVRERCTVERCIWRAGRVGGRALPRRRRRRARDLARRSSSAPTAAARPSPRCVGAWTPYRRLAQRPRPGLPLPGRPARGHRRRGDDYQWRDGDSFAFAFPSAPAGKLLVLLMGHRDEVARGAQGSRGLLAAQAARASRAGRAARRRARHRDQAALDRRDAGLLPRLDRARAGRWPATPATSRTRSPARACATRCGWAARSPSTSCPVLDDPAAIDRATRALGGRARPRVPARLPLRQPRHPRRAPVPGPLRAGPRRRAAPRSPTSRDLFGRARTLQEIAPLPRLARALGAALWRGERPRAETAARRRPRRCAPSSRSAASVAPIASAPTRTGPGLRPPGRRVARAAHAPPRPRRHAEPAARPTAQEEVPA